MQKKVATPELPIRILKIGTCPSLSARSQLTYHIGCHADEFHVRIVQNSGNGQFNADWVPVALIEKLLSAHAADQPITSRAMQPIFRSKSSNSPAFLFAALKSEGLVLAGTEKDSGYTLGNIEAFRQSVLAMIASDTDLSAQADAPAERSKKKRSSKDAA